MKCKRERCQNEARPISDPHGDHIETAFCSWDCLKMFLKQREIESSRREEYKRPENTLLRIEGKLDKLLQALIPERGTQRR